MILSTATYYVWYVLPSLSLVHTHAHTHTRAHAHTRTQLGARVLKA